MGGVGTGGGELRALGKAAVVDVEETPPKERSSVSGAREVAEPLVGHGRWHVPVLPTLPSLLEEPHMPLIHRDLSWLQFNDRVLDEARPSSGNPLLERVKFLAISASNLDEFFMIRFASLGRRIRQRARAAAGGGAESAARLVQIRDAILETVAKFVARQEEVLDLLVAELAEEHIHLVKEGALSEETRLLGRRVFESHVLPKLSAPETFDPVKLLQLENLKIAVSFPDGLCFRVSRTLPSVFPARSEDGRLFFFFLDDLLLTHLGPSFGIAGVPGAVRLTRDADFTVDIGDGDPSSIPDRVRQGIGDRERGVPVRLQYVGRIIPEKLESARTTLKLVPGQILPGPGTLGLHGLWSLVSFRAPEMLVENPKLRYGAHAALVPKEFDGEDLFASLRAQDYLLHHPYDSFDAYLRVLERASVDPAVEEIALTIYRVDRGSPIIESLKTAAARGKRVRAIVELRARFDESRNLEVADELRRAGVRVLRVREAETSRQSYAHQPARERRATTVHALVDGELQRRDGPVVHGHGDSHRQRRDRAGRGDVLRGGEPGEDSPHVQATGVRADGTSPPLAVAHRCGDRSGEARRAHGYFRESERARGRARHRRALPRVASGRPRGPRGARRVLAHSASEGLERQHPRHQHRRPLSRAQPHLLVPKSERDVLVERRLDAAQFLFALGARFSRARSGHLCVHRARRRADIHG
jgi:hypothetical protein